MNNKFDSMMEEFKENVSVEVNSILKSIQDYFRNCNTNRAVVGMSGGIDCSVVARLLQMAGIDVTLILMPNGESMNLAGDKNDSMDLINKFNFQYSTFSITDTVASLLSSMCVSYNPHKQNVCLLRGVTGDIEGENIELSEMAIANINPRIRMIMLYTLAQSMNALVVGTGNLSEITMGYFTKWGDGASDFNPIKEYTKSEIRIIAKHIGIPERIITKAPSANLWVGQTDEDEMGITYYDLDRYILTKEGSKDTIEKVERTIKRVAHKNNPIATHHR